ncbi:glycosyl transferase family 2 [Arachidicoccus ginsenosidimutans]|uniref:GtrA family protein n=1 Tax=Arachidicoccus sp. BS20 TaxID=1850526 RepID=UPI0007F0BEBC|nr:GtrA family protein [Arachidicoccus sp. BS20]ANI90211.1 glycosyl transferase family 2 [Arachidicoccus sp. BS20]
MNIFFKFIRFGIVGFSGMIVDFSVTWLLKEKLKINKYIANSFGFVCAASSNYLLNRIWTFQSRQQNIEKEYLSFFIVSLIGLGINNGIIFLLTRKGKMNFYIAKLIAVAIVILWNFTANDLITFRT